jgi:hypothetical protein
MYALACYSAYRKNTEKAKTSEGKLFEWNFGNASASWSDSKIPLSQSSTDFKDVAGKFLNCSKGYQGGW